MFVEYQFDTPTVLALMRSRLAGQPICVTDPIPSSLLGDSVTRPLYLDHVVVKDTTWIERIDADPDIVVYPGEKPVAGQWIQIVQPVDVFLAYPDDLAAADTEPLPSGTYFQRALAFVFKVFASHDKDGWTLHVDFVELRALDDKDLNPLVGAIVSAQMGGLKMSSPIGLQSLKSAASNLHIAQAFVGAPLDGSFLALRLGMMSLKGLDSRESWEHFLNGHIPRHLSVSWQDPPPPPTFDPNGKPIKHPIDGDPPAPKTHTASGDFTVFVDFGLIAPTVEQKLTANTSDQLTITSPVVAWWYPMANLSRFMLVFDAEISDVGPLHNTVSGTLTITAAMFVVAGSKPGTTALQIRAGVDADLDAGSKALLFVEGILLGSLGGALLGAISFQPIGAAIGAVAGALAGAGFVEDQINAVDATAEIPATADCKVEQDELVCTYPLDSVSDPVFGKLALGSTYPLDDGPLFLGHLTHAATKSPPAIQGVLVTPFEWQYALHPLHQVAHAQVAITASGDWKATLCGARPLPGSDPKGQLAAKYITTKTLTAGDKTVLRVTIEIPDSEVLPAYAAEPYPFVVLVQTDAGARAVTVGPIPALTASIKSQLQAAGERAAVAQVAELAPLWTSRRHAQPQWIAGDAPRDAEAVRVWTATFRGLTAQERLSWVDGRGHELAAIAGGGGGALRTAAAASEPLALARAGGPESAEGRGAAVAEELWVRAARLPANGARALVAGHLGRTPMVVVINDGGLHDFWDVSTPERPRRVRRAALPGLRGVTPVSRGYLAWGDAGMQMLPPNGRCAPAELAADWPKLDGRFHGAVVAKDRIFALASDGVHVVDLSLRRRGFVNASAMALRLEGGRLVLEGAAGPVHFDLAVPDEPRRLPTVVARGARRAPTGAAVGHASDWLAGCVFVAGVGARIESDGTTGIWRLEGSALVG